MLSFLKTPILIQIAQILLKYDRIKIHGIILKAIRNNNSKYEIAYFILCSKFNIEYFN